MCGLFGMAALSLYIEHHETKHLIWSSSSHKIPFILMDTSKYTQTVVLQLYEIRVRYTCWYIVGIIQGQSDNTHQSHCTLMVPT